MKFVYRFPVARGIQATREYYIAMVPLNMIGRLFASDAEHIPPEYRAQRRLNEARIPVISKYILDNRHTYTFSALAASIDGAFAYTPSELNADVGILEIAADARFLINDGQHRKAAIMEALREDSTLADESIPIVFFADQGLAHSQQIFTDLNKNAVKTSNSISELYDSRDRIAVLTRDVVGQIDFLNAYTDKEKDILGKYSSNLFTLNTFYTANKLIIGTAYPQAKVREFLLRFWSCIVQHMLPWKELEQQKIAKIDLREKYIATQNVVIQALGRIGSYFFNHPERDMEQCIAKLDKIKWHRSAPIWLYRAIQPNGRIITNKKAAMLIANVLKQAMEIPLTEDEMAAEKGILKEAGQ